MPPWHNIVPTDRVCRVCSGSFTTKRKALYCSPLCASRARPARAYDPAYRLPYAKKRRETHGGQIREQERARRDAVQVFIRSVKTSNGCADCGYSAHHAALEFDHLGDKLLNVCNSKSIEQAKLEIAKCEVVCANCHRIRTYERLQTQRRPDPSAGGQYKGED